jgi:hypothetical protein
VADASAQTRAAIHTREQQQSAVRFFRMNELVFRFYRGLTAGRREAVHREPEAERTRVKQRKVFRIRMNPDGAQHQERKKAVPIRRGTSGNGLNRESASNLIVVWNPSISQLQKGEIGTYDGF